MKIGENRKDERQVSSILTWLLYGVIWVLVIYLANSYQTNNLKQYITNYITYEGAPKQWYIYEESIIIENPHKNIIGQMRLPLEKTKEHRYLLFETKGCGLQVYQDEELIYDSLESKMNQVKGHQYHFVYLHDEVKETNIQFVLIPQSKVRGIELYPIIQGNFLYINQHLINEYLPEFIFAIFSFGLCLFAFIISGVVMKLRVEFDELLQMGILSGLVGIWNLTQSGIVDIYLPNSSIGYNLGCTSYIIIGCLVVYYFKVQYGQRYYLVTKILCGTQYIVAIVTILLNLCGLVYYDSSLVYNYIVTLALAWIIGGIMIYEDLYVKEVPKYEKIAILGILLCTNAEIINRYLLISTRLLGIFQIGIIGFVIMLVINNVKHMIHLYRQTLKMDFLHEKAYLDGLTKAYNRYAFEEYTKRTNRDMVQSNKLIVVLLDINFLKYVNDYYGHDYGDRMICHTADLLKEVFNDSSYVYRTGGDEFVVTIEGKDIDYVKHKIRLLESKFLEYKIGDRSLQAAIGLSSYDEHRKKTLTQIIKEADERMYIDKAKKKEVGNN